MASTLASIAFAFTSVKKVCDAVRIAADADADRPWLPGRAGGGAEARWPAMLSFPPVTTVYVDSELLAQATDAPLLPGLRERGVRVGALALGDTGAQDPQSEPDLARMATLLRQAPPPVYVVSGNWALARAAEGLGGRGLLVLDGREMDEVLGEAEAEPKSLPVAVDLAMAERYLEAELAEQERLGPFRFAQPAAAVAGGRPPALSRGDLLRLLGLVVLAGLTFALGVAYLLQEAYQTISVPRALQWPVKFLTLQWIPQTLRGLMFLLLGVAIGVAVTRVLSRLSRARQG